MNIIKIFNNIPGIFEYQFMTQIPAPFGIEIENEGRDIIYLGPNLDKWSMFGDRLRIIKDIKTSVNEAKYEQAGKTN